jgi:flagellar export protein FliJ
MGVKLPKFNLQTVLDYRHSKVEALEVELSKLIQKQFELTQLLDSIQVQITALNNELQEKQIGEINLFTISVLRSNINLLNEKIDQIKAAMEKLVKSIEEKRQEVVLARQDEEVLEILKQKEIDRFKEEVKVQEGRAQDEIYIAQAFRKLSNEV